MEKTASCYRCALVSVEDFLGFKVLSLPLFLKKGAKEFVDQNMLRSQRSRRHRRQPRPNLSNCPGPSQPAEESKPGDSDHETTSSSGGKLLFGGSRVLRYSLFRRGEDKVNAVSWVGLCFRLSGSIVYFTPAATPPFSGSHLCIFGRRWESFIHVRLFGFLFSVAQPRKINLPWLTLYTVPHVLAPAHMRCSFSPFLDIFIFLGSY